MRVDDIIEAAQSQAREVSPAAIAHRLKDYLVLDVREPQEALFGYLPGAINVPRGTIESRVSVDVLFADPQRAILVYSGEGKRSALAALTFAQLGFSDVQSLLGGFEQWAKEDRPIE